MGHEYDLMRMIGWIVAMAMSRHLLMVFAIVVAMRIIDSLNGF